ncbi:hypothetical protein PHYPSEUDO_015098 [Phytophthora pseudosyringae]|uniref:Uncharacterized protein n=1 Tax=Phytophthora pseudosyringae TaxID=221518 RepID=A0A8T1W456_9STRA|nr:hypothetical protein PHYPSEUDO_015098 [Phytophthora pseudosyringae]
MGVASIVSSSGELLRALSFSIASHSTHEPNTFTMNTADSPKLPEYERPPVMEHFKQSGSTRKLNTQPSLPMLGAGGKQHSQDMLAWESTPEPASDYVSNDQNTLNDANGPQILTRSTFASLLCCCRRR